MRYAIEVQEDEHTASNTCVCVTYPGACVSRPQTVHGGICSLGGTVLRPGLLKCSHLILQPAPSLAAHNRMLRRRGKFNK